MLSKKSPTRGFQLLYNMYRLSLRPVLEYRDDHGQLNDTHTSEAVDDHIYFSEIVTSVCVYACISTLHNACMHLYITQRILRSIQVGV